MDNNDETNVGGEGTGRRRARRQPQGQQPQQQQPQSQQQQQPQQQQQQHNIDNRKQSQLEPIPSQGLAPVRQRQRRTRMTANDNDANDNDNHDYSDSTQPRLQQPAAPQQQSSASTTGAAAPGRRRKGRRDPGGLEMESLPESARLGMASNDEANTKDDSGPLVSAHPNAVSGSPKRVFQPPELENVVCDEEDIVGEEVAAPVGGGPTLQDTYGTSTHQQVLFTETTGAGFRPVQRRKEEISGVKTEVENENTNTLERLFNFVHLLTAAAFIFAHGLLGGTCMCVLLLAALSSRNDFLQAYGGIGMHIQRCFFVLSTICIVGSLEKYIKDKLVGWHPRTANSQRLLDLTIILCYVACFICSIFCAPIDELIYISSRRVPGWFQYDNIDPTFMKNLDAWEGLNAARCICGLVGWLLLSLETRTYIEHGPAHVLNAIYEHVNAQKESTRFGVPGATLTSKQ